MCSSRYYRSKFTKQQNDVCNQLRAENFRNQPRRESYTNHHWTHVIAKSESWKRKNTVKISDIVPNLMDVNKVLDKLEQEIKELVAETKILREKEGTKS